MAVRKIEFAVNSDGITPSVKQFAGVQGDHKATEVVFNIAPELYRSLTSQATNGAKLIYRFDGYDGEGGFKSSDTAELTESQLSYELEEWLTRFGGIVKVVLVISALKDDLTQMELFNFPALLQLKNSPEGVETDGINRESMSTLAQVAKDSANTAVEAKNIAVEAQNKTELARAALENGTVWVFDGGNAAGDVDLDGDGTPDMNTADVKFVVDGEMSDSSENTVKNKVIKAYVDAANKTVSRLSEDLKLTNQNISENTEEITTIKETLQKMADYPIESGYQDGWYWEKWNSGKMELWGRFESTIKAPDDASGTTCRYTANLPVTFAGHPVLVVSGLQLKTYSSYIMMAHADAKTIGIYMKCTNPINSEYPCYFQARMTGRWK